MRGRGGRDGSRKNGAGFKDRKGKSEARVSAEVHRPASVQGLNKEKGVPGDVCRVCEWARERVSQVCLQQGPRDFQK